MNTRTYEDSRSTPLQRIYTKDPNKKKLQTRRPGTELTVSHTQKKYTRPRLVSLLDSSLNWAPLPCRPTAPARSCALLPRPAAPAERGLVAPHLITHLPSEVRRLLTCLPTTRRGLAPLPCLLTATVRSCNPSPAPSLDLQRLAEARVLLV
jgi:hypothetical protein